jgi:hypothetical protein
MYEETKVSKYNSMKFKIAKLKFDINKWWNLEILLANIKGKM